MSINVCGCFEPLLRMSRGPPICHLRALYWWWRVLHRYSSSWAVLALAKGLPLSGHWITSFFFTAKPRKNTNWSWTNGLEHLTLQCWQCVCMCISVCLCMFFFGGGVWVNIWGLHSLLAVLPTLRTTHSFILWTTGTGRTWLILARSVCTSRWTQSGWKEPLKPTNASLSAGRANNIKVSVHLSTNGFSALPGLILTSQHRGFMCVCCSARNRSL